MGNSNQGEPVGRTTRRSYLMSRAAGGLLLVAIVYFIFGGEQRSIPLVIGMVVVAVLLWLWANAIDRKRSRRDPDLFDENGNARPKKL